MSSGEEKRQRPEIDGLRSFAIIPVVLFHSGLGFPGGFLGVDVFFVISGFLIGGIILRELDSGVFSFVKFWERRFRRIVPILLVFTAFVLGAGLIFLLPSDLASLGAQSVAMLVGLANLKMLALTGGYWAKPAESLALLHTWSLAVEEQFYVVMPLILALSHRWFRRGLPWVIIGAFSVSLSLSLFWSTNQDPKNFYVLPSRAWELSLGCLGAWAVHQKMLLRGRAGQAATAIGLVSILVASLELHNDPSWPSIWTLIPTVGAVLVLISPPGEDETRLPARILSLPPLRFIGLISYSLYLWHWPLLVFLKEYGPEQITPILRWMVVIISIVMAALSWRFVEQPFRNRLPGFRVSFKPLLGGASTLWVCLLAISVWFASRASSESASGLNIPASLNVGKGLDSIAPYDATSRLEEGGVLINAQGLKPRCVVVGTSHAMMLGTAIESLAETYHVPTAFLCMPATNASALFTLDHGDLKKPKKVRVKLKNDELVRKWIAQWHPDLIILASKWDYEMQWNDKAEWTYPTFQDAISNTVTWLAANSSKVVIVGQIPELPGWFGRQVQNTVWRLYQRQGNVMPWIREPLSGAGARLEILNLLQSFQFTNVAVVDPSPILLKPDHTIRYYLDSGLLYYDDNHLNEIGSLQCRSLLEPFFKEIAK